MCLRGQITTGMVEHYIIKVVQKESNFATPIQYKVRKHEKDLRLCHVHVCMYSNTVNKIYTVHDQIIGSDALRNRDDNVICLVNLCQKMSIDMPRNPQIPLGNHLEVRAVHGDHTKTDIGSTLMTLWLSLWIPQAMSMCCVSNDLFAVEIDFSCMCCNPALESGSVGIRLFSTSLT